MDEAILFGVLLLTLVMFAAGPIRYDIVALSALIFLTVVGIVSPSEAFLGFSHPAVVTVAAVFVLSEIFRSSGIVDVMGRWFSRVGETLTSQIASLSALVAILSAFMNNVGALSVLLPLAIRMARGGSRPYSPYLMPLAFSSLLGGMTTLVGTPPNIIIASFRESVTGEAFTMFDFTPVGLSVALSGVIFIALVGWRLIPTRKAQSTPGETIEIADYMTEVRVTEDSRYVGRLVRDLEELAQEDVAIVGLIHRGTRYGAPSSYQIIDAGDVFIIEANPEDLKHFVDETGFELEGFSNIRSDVEKTVVSDDVSLLEAVVMPNGQADGSNAASLHLHSEYGVNLLAVSRSGARVVTRLSRVVLQAGDVLLLQGRTELMVSALPRLNLLPLADRDLRIGQPRRLVIPIAVFVGALLLTIFDLLPIHVSLVGAVTLLLLSRFITLQSAYRAVNWPIIVLVGAMIPVGGALESTGGAARIATVVTDMGATFPPWAILAIILITTMLLSDVVNNSTAVILMAPVAMRVAETIGASVDPFLMAVAIGGSSAFLTPIGHQSNTIVMGPGGYRFGDYWRMGLPLDLIIVTVSIPILMLVWPPGI